MDDAWRHSSLQDYLVAIHNSQLPHAARTCFGDHRCDRFLSQQHNAGSGTARQANGSEQLSASASTVNMSLSKDTTPSNARVAHGASAVPIAAGATNGESGHQSHTGRMRHNSCVSTEWVTEVSHAEPNLSAQHVPVRSRSRTPSDLAQCAPPPQRRSDTFNPTPPLTPTPWFALRCDLYAGQPQCGGFTHAAPGWPVPLPEQSFVAVVARASASTVQKLVQMPLLFYQGYESCLQWPCPVQSVAVCPTELASCTHALLTP